jgi:hypothetical protein
MLIPLWTLSQDITTTQRNRIDSIFTAEKIIDISKGLSNEKLQDSVIKVRDNQIKELQDKVALLKKEHTNTLIEIAKHNKTAEETTSTVDDISDNQLKKEKNKWKGLHLYGGVEIPQFKFNEPNFNTELMYELERFEFGVKGEFGKLDIEKETGYNFNYYLKLRYKFF